MSSKQSITPKHHADRIKTELIKAGVTQYGLLKAEARHLPSLIDEDEHIHGVVYGRADFGSAMIVATNKRVFYLDHRVLFNKTDELTYDVVSGVSHNKQSGYAGIVLHTRLGDFSLKFVNLRCANNFVNYIESRQIMTQQNNHPKQDVVLPHFYTDQALQSEYSKRAHLFLMSHETGVLSTVTRNDVVQGAVVYYAIDKNDLIYVVTKSKTAKAQNIIYHPLVAFTVYDPSSMQTLQIEAIAQVESDPNITQKIYKTVLNPRFSNGHAELPPILYLPAGEYEVIVLKTLRYKFTDYKTQSEK